MRVLFFNYEYPPLGGGAANATAYLLAEYAKVLNLEVDLITSSLDDEYHLEKIGEKINVHRVPIGKNAENLHFQSQKDLLLYSWRAFWFARKLTRKNKYDLSHAFFSVPCGFLACIFWKTRKIPYIVSLRGADVPGYSERFSELYALLKPLIKKIWKEASFVIANSRGLRELALLTNDEQKIEIIENGVDTERFYPDEKRKSSAHFIITPGASRVTARKGLRYLVEAVDRLVEKYPQIMVRILGDGSERGDLERMSDQLALKKHIQFIGRVPREETAAYYQEADLFVLPSLNEGMSNAMLEALACGLPLVTTETGGSGELVEEGVNGFMVKMKEVEDLKNKIEKFLLDENLGKKMGLASRKKALLMGWDKVAEKYVDFYRRTLKR